MTGTFFPIYDLNKFSFFYAHFFNETFCLKFQYHEF